MRAIFPVAVFFGMTVILYLAFLLKVPALVSILLLIPLLFWLRTRKAAKLSTTKTDSTVQRALPVTLSLYLLVMIVRTPSVIFLGFPLEKTPLIFPPGIMGHLCREEIVGAVRVQMEQTGQSGTVRRLSLSQLTVHPATGHAGVAPILVRVQPHQSR